MLAELWNWGLPQAAVALVLAGAMGIATLVTLRKRGPKSRLAREGEAFMWAMVYAALGVSAWLLAGFLWLSNIQSSTAGLGVLVAMFVAPPAAVLWSGQLFVLGAAAGRLGGRSMHLMLAATTLAGAAAAWATPVVVMQLLRAGLMSDDGAAIPMVLGTMPLGSAIAGLAVAPFLPVGAHAKGRCMRCGYDLAGLPAPTPAEGAVRCPECGYHPWAPQQERG